MQLTPLSNGAIRASLAPSRDTMNDTVIVVRKGVLKRTWVIRLETDIASRHFAAFSRCEDAIEVALLLAQVRNLPIRVESVEEE